MSKLTRICRPLAPEDVVRGLHVIVLTQLDEFFVGCADETLGRRKVDVARVRILPPCLEPLEVVDVCLPLIVTRGVDGEIRCLDVRRHELARLPDKLGRRLVRRLREAIRKADRRGESR